MSINDVITEGGKGLGEKQTNQEDRDPGRSCWGEVLFFIELHFRKAFLRE